LEPLTELEGAVDNEELNNKAPVEVLVDFPMLYPMGHISNNTAVLAWRS
jgi:hypothetical protein